MKKIQRIILSEKIRQVSFYQFYQYWKKNKLSFDIKIDEIGINEKYPGFLSDFNFENVNWDILSECISIQRREGFESFSTFISSRDHLFCFYEDTLENLYNLKNFKDFPLLFDSYELSLFNDLVRVEFYNSVFLYNSEGTELNYFASPNLYDEGYCRIEFLDEIKLILGNYDNNNGHFLRIYDYLNKNISEGKIDSIKLLEELQKKDIIWRIDQFSDQLKENRNAILLSFKVDNTNIGLYIDGLSEGVITDREIVREAVAIDGSVLQFASEELKNDKEIVTTAIKSNFFSVNFCSSALRIDRKFIQELSGYDDTIRAYLESDDFQKGIDLEILRTKNNNPTNNSDIELPF